MLMNGGRNKPPFTPSQWQELETQALIFKHMVSGIPIPPELLFPLKFHSSSSSSSSLSSSSLLSSKLFLPSDPQIPWAYYHMGLGRKIDPEPGRCRRTDGKKWRCAKEAYNDSKYCEKHMHRGRNRSRKPVEIVSASASTNHGSPFKSYYNSNSSPSASSSSSSRYGFPYSPPKSTTTHFASDSTDSSPYGRSVNGLKDERSFFAEKPDLSLDSSNSNSWKYTPLRMNSSSSSVSVSPALQNGLFSQFDHINHNHNNHHQQEQQQQQQQNQQQHCYVLGTDIFKSVKPEKQQQQEQDHHHQQQQNHQFLQFIDEYPLRNREQSSSTTAASTQLSISIPHPFL